MPHITTDLESGGGLSSLGSSPLPDPQLPTINSAGKKRGRTMNQLQKKSTFQSVFGNPRTLIALLCAAAASSMVSGTMLATFHPQVPAKVSNRTLSFTERVSFQRAIEEVYWRHRIWPKERPDSKPSLDAVMSQAQLEKKVADYLGNSQALEDYWQQPIRVEQLQAEMERMAQHSKQPEVLRELFEALGNDPFVIAECLARPALAERLVTNLYAHDERFHGELRQRAEADLLAHHTVEQMKQTSGMYSEIELVRSDSTQGGDNRGVEPGVKLDSREWDQNVQKLAAMFGEQPVAAGVSPAKGVPTQIKTGVVSPLQEDEARYYASAVIEKTSDHLKVLTVSWRKEPLESWRARGENQMPKVLVARSANYTPPRISAGTNGCTDDTWTATSTIAVPDVRDFHTAVWTGSEMIVWGGFDNISNVNTGGRYNPSTDSWTATSTLNAPEARSFHTAVWTGNEMIIWGGAGSGNNYFNTGGRYDPGTDSWTATSTLNAPLARELHTAVWTGNEMIIWGGGFNTGGRYSPCTDGWTATSTINAPSPRSRHTAVWTGNEMIVWGGSGFPNNLNTGGRYNPTTDSWAATSTANAPVGRDYHTAVWTGSEMIVWGGSGGQGFTFNSGGRYNPHADSWTATSSINVPNVRYIHTAVWTGSEMIVWGGLSAIGCLHTGGRYNPSTDSWTATSTTNAPSGRYFHTAVWTGSQMIVWGGYDCTNYLNTGGKYCAIAATPTPTPTPTPGPPIVTTILANYVASFSARLQGTVNPLGLTTNVYFQYGTTTNYGSVTPNRVRGGNTTQYIFANIPGLSASTTYHFRIVAMNADGTSYGADRTFTTLPATGRPVAVTSPATNVTSSSATLNGIVDPHGLATSVYFQYGTTFCYGVNTPAQSHSGNTYLNISANVSALSPSTTYHFRIVATNQHGTRYGADRTFTTP
jgi:N-acetylneuraminic acid mutarotase